MLVAHLIYSKYEYNRYNIDMPSKEYRFALEKLNKDMRGCDEEVSLYFT